MAAPSLPHAVSGERVEFDSAAGRLSIYVAGKGAPLLLIHSINAAGSAAEVRPLHEHYRATRRVFSLDLPGFGFSERSDRVYSPRLMTDAVHAATELIRARSGDAKRHAPIDALALSLSCEYLARAAAEAPAAYRSLAFVSPTGFNAGAKRRGPPGTSLGPPWAYKLVRGPGWAAPLYRGLTRPGVIRYFLRRTWGSKQIDEALLAYDVITARQPGAMYAPLYFLSAALFSADIHTVYEQLTMPVWLSHGVRGDFTDYRGTTLIEDRPNWRVSLFPTGALPHFEVPLTFATAYNAFLAAP